MKKIWPFGYYFVYFAAIAVYAPYLVLLYQSLDFTGTQIGLLTGITPLISLISVPFWTGLADTTSRHRLIMSLSMLVGISGLVLFPLLKTFALIFSLAILLNFFFAPVNAFADSASMFMLAGRKDLIGRLRLGGTIGFGIAAPIAGILVEKHGLKMAFWGGAVLFFAGFLISQKLVHGSEIKGKPVKRGRVSDLLRNPLWLLFLLAAFTCGFAFAASNTYLFPFMKGLSFPESIMGWALAFGTIAEIPILIFVNRLLKRIEPFTLLLFSMVLTGIRLFLFAATTTPTFILLPQLLNGFGYPLTWVAGVSFADKNAPDGYRATAQGLFSTVAMSLGAAVGGFTGGLIFENIGGRELYLIFGSVVFLVAVLVWIFQHRLPAKKLTPSVN